jgi:glycosyltransferase involved in cell wall biosynthesis
MTRQRILMFGYLPPPYFGPSVTYQSLLRSEFKRHFDVTFVNLSLVSNVAELEKFRIHKVLCSIRILIEECYYLMTRRFDFCSCPVSVNRNAFLRDALLLAVARLFRVSTIVYAHGNNLPDFYARSSPLMKRVIDATCGGAAGGIVMGQSLLPNLSQWLPPDRIFPATDGIEVFSPMPEVQRNPRAISVLYLGNLIPAKGVFVILDAAAKISRERKDIRFVFGGAWFKNEDEKRAKEFVAKQGLTGCVEFVGPVIGEQKWRLLLSANMLVFPTHYYYETLGLVLLEAMQVGLPVITTRRAAIPDIIDDGVNGLFVAEQDPVDLAEKILRLADDPLLRARMGQANRVKFINGYTHEHYGQRMIAVFEALSTQMSVPRRSPASKS